MSAVRAQMKHAGLPLDQIHALVMAWLENRDMRTIEDVDRLNWLFCFVELVDRKETGRQQFSVHWTGSVRPPTDGVYTFSICPIDLNFKSGSTFREQKTKIWVADQQILDSAQDGWTYKGRGVTLSASQATPIRIELSFDCSVSGVISGRPAVALLAWETAGTSRQLVPNTAFSTPDGTAHGLLGEYLIKTGEKELHATRVDPQLNFIWYHQCFVVSPRDELRKQLADQLYAVASSPSTIARWEKDPRTNPGHLQAQWAFLESLSAARHKQWAELLVAHPVLLADCTNREASNLYCRCRVGAPDEALRAVGLWAQAHCDESPLLAADFFAANRAVYRDFSRRMVWQYPPHLAAFEQGYLQLPDGRCALPVAYTLAYGYWVKGRIDAWIDQLDARLGDPQLTGDRRVNWLIARAQAEEIRHGRPKRHWFAAERFLAGRPWLDEACLVAQSQPVRLRAFKERAARMLVDERIATARQVLDDAAERCSSAESAASLAKWRSEIDSLSHAFDARHAQRQTAAKDAYRRQLQSRRDRAVKRGDSEAATRYEHLLGQDNE